MTPNRKAPDGLGFAQSEKWLEVYEATFRETMQGTMAVFAFSSGKEWDNEQELDMLRTVGLALKCPGYTPETVGLAVLRCVAKVANEYASWKADEAAALIDYSDDQHDQACDDAGPSYVPLN